MKMLCRKMQAPLFALFAAAAACSDATAPNVEPAQTSSAPATAGRTTPSRASSAAPEDDADEALPHEKFSDGARAFAKVRETLLANYYSEGISEDDIYRAATVGLLEKLEPRMGKWNALLSPRERAELANDLKGEVVGVGVAIKFDPESGYADVLNAIPGSAAEKGGILTGDKIVSVNGKLYKGMTLPDVVADIRGKAGESVKLTVLRGAKLRDFSLVRSKLAYDEPTSALLPDDVGYLKIPSFTEKTTQAVREILSSFEAKKVTAVIVDVRQSPGGAFEQAVATTQLFLPEGTPVVTVKLRHKPEEKHVAKGTPLVKDAALVVLVDGATASGAEVLAAALQEGRHARIVGERTTGKWSVQSVEELSNGYGFKYTVSLLKTPSGRSFEGSGLPPDVVVSMDEHALALANVAPTPAARLERDVQLRTAKALVSHR